jgi:hypothetical protein
MACNAQHPSLAGVQCISTAPANGHDRHYFDARFSPELAEYADEDGIIWWDNGDYVPPPPSPSSKSQQTARLNEIVSQIPREHHAGPVTTFDRAFIEFHEKNPHVYAILCRLAREAVKAGRGKIGIGLLWEVMRWELFLQTHDPESEFKLNNNYRSRYARLIMEKEPDLAGVFETRLLRT